MKAIKDTLWVLTGGAISIVLASTFLFLLYLVLGVIGGSTTLAFAVIIPTIGYIVWVSYEGTESVLLSLITLVGTIGTLILYINNF